MAEKTPGSSDLTFEERINQVLDKRLRDQTTLPAEFRSWLPKFIEIQDIRLPISQVSGAYLTATDTVDLGGDVHGRIGMVRGGSAPYDFTQVTFDSVYDKWVANAFIVGALPTDVAFTTTSTTYTGVTGMWLPLVPWRNYDTANLVPQFRTIIWCSITGGATMSITIGVQTADANSALSAVSDGSWSTTTTSAGSIIKDTGWQDMPSVAVADFLFPTIRVKTSSGAQTISVYAASMWCRWVSQ